MDLPEKNVVLWGPCERELITLPDAYFDSIVTDPPYGLGTREPTGEDIERYLKGEALDTGGDFMGKPWEIPSVPVWKQCFRVLKPGGYLLSFAGTRTWDIMSVGIRAAGFEDRDTISSHFGAPCLQWVHSQGFPKSMNISKELRKRADSTDDPIDKAKLLELAEEYEGYGTALKPAWEPVLCFRKPTVSDNTLEQVIATGTGVINIDGTRVKHSSPEDLEKHKEQVERIRSQGGKWGDSWKNSSDLSGANEVTAAGRWPANMVITHLPECKVVDRVTVPGYTINRFTDGMKPFGEGAGHPYEKTETEAEQLPVYECAPGCPAKVLNEQTEDLVARSNQKPSLGGGGSFGHPKMDHPFVSYGDSGGAARFFAQFMPDAPFFYTGKASKREKNEGVLEGKPSRKKGQRLMILREQLSDQDKQRIVAEWPSDKPAPSFAQLEFLIPESLRDLFEEARPNENPHPTVKPLSLMRWLVRLVTPKGGVVLDPYCGSGTTCLAALEEECDYIAIDKDEMYKKLADKRLAGPKAKILGKRSEDANASAFDNLTEVE